MMSPIAEIPVGFDVAVVGAGSAGVAAAVAAAESGARTVLIEASEHVGGTLVGQLLEHSAGFHDVVGNQVVGGVAQRIVDRLKAFGGTPGHIRDDVGYTATRTPVNDAELAMAEAVLLKEAGVELWLRSPVVAATVCGEQDAARVDRLDVETPQGRRAVRATAVVDCSGDAVVAALAGATFHADAAGSTQPASMLLRLGGVDFTELLDYARRNPADLRPGNLVGDAEADHVNLWGFGRLLALGWRDGLLSWRRSEMHLAGWPTRGEAILNVTRRPWDPGAAGATYLQLAQQVLEVVAWFRAVVPGGERAYLADVADRVGVRESRRVVGRATITREHVVAGGRSRDSIALGAFPIDIHAAGASGMAQATELRSSFDVPYGALVAAGPSNLLVGGRCISSTHEANGSVRITATCMATGEAAGVAAALAAADGIPAVEVSIGALQQRLRARGVLGARPGAPTDC